MTNVLIAKGFSVLGRVGVNVEAAAFYQMEKLLQEY